MMKTGVPPTAENLRVEVARYRLDRKTVCEIIGMNPNSLTLYLNETRAMPWWAAHNIGYAINKYTGLWVFDVDMKRGVIPKKLRHALRDPRNTVKLGRRGVAGNTSRVR